MYVLYEYIKEFLLGNGLLPRIAIYGSALISFFILVLVASIVYVILPIFSLFLFRLPQFSPRNDFPKGGNRNVAPCQ